MTKHTNETRDRFEAADEERRAGAALLSANSFARLIHGNQSLWRRLSWQLQDVADGKTEPDSAAFNDAFLAAWERDGSTQVSD